MVASNASYRPPEPYIRIGGHFAESTSLLIVFKLFTTSAIANALNINNKEMTGALTVKFAQSITETFRNLGTKERTASPGTNQTCERTSDFTFHK